MVGPATGSGNRLKTVSSIIRLTTRTGPARTRRNNGVGTTLNATLSSRVSKADGARADHLLTAPGGPLP
ncbi:MAG: hypothetical protein JWN97_2448 [Nocardioides sp.]|nr:hypothetical protein [Nocardioides sp.]